MRKAKKKNTATKRVLKRAYKACVLEANYYKTEQFFWIIMSKGERFSEVVEVPNP